MSPPVVMQILSSMKIIMGEDGTNKGWSNSRSARYSSSLHFVFLFSWSYSRPQRARFDLLVSTKNGDLWEDSICWARAENLFRIQTVRLHSEHAQSDGKSVNRGLSVLDLPRGSTAVKWVRMLKPHAPDKVRVGMHCTISIETSKRQNGSRFICGICFHFAGIRRKQNS